MAKQDLLKIQIYFIARFTEMYLFYKDKKKIPQIHNESAVFVLFKF